MKTEALNAAKDGNKLVYKEGRQTIVIQAWGRDGLRVRVTPEGGGQTSDWALDIPLETEGKISISPTESTLRNRKISVRIHDMDTQKGHMDFFRHSGKQTIPILSEEDYLCWAHNPGTRTFQPAGDGLFRAELHFAARDGERFHGMGQNATRHLNLKGSVIDLYQRHVKAVVPFVVSSEGYGFLWNNPSLGRVEFGDNRTRWISDGCRQMDYFITAGDSYAEILEHYADATGHAPEFPYWASGFWQCKYIYGTQEEFLATAREFKRRGLPLSVLVIDAPHWDVAGNWRLDPKCWPDPKAMIRELDEMGVRIMISPQPFVREESENFAYMKAHGLFTGSIGGIKDKVNFGNSGSVYQYDPTNPEAAAYLWSKWKANYFDLGIRTFWLDPCDESHEIPDYDQVLFHIGPARESHSWFVVAHQKNICDGLHAAGEKEVVTICRNAWAGSQRYGACPAPHDILSSFEHMEQYLKAGLNVMMSGIPWWNCDIGGFVPTENTSSHLPAVVLRFQELMVRWYQWGVFMPVFRTHGYRKNNEAWTIGEEAYPHIRAAMLLREKLRPYIMKQMKLASRKGLPPMRPLFVDFMDDPKAAAVEDEFLFGPDILVAPILKYQQRNREVYLPAGIEWTDTWTGRKLRGGQVIKAEAPLEHIPVYLRGDKPELLKLFRNLYGKHCPAIEWPMVVREFRASRLRAPVADIAAARPPRPGLAWKPVPFMSEYELADIRDVHVGADGVVYIEAAVKHDGAYRGELSYGADGPVKVWVNGRAVDRRPQATNPARIGEYVVPVSWKKGVNRIAFALATNQGRAWGVQARILKRARIAKTGALSS